MKYMDEYALPQVESLQSNDISIEVNSKAP